MNSKKRLFRTLLAVAVVCLPYIALAEDAKSRQSRIIAVRVVGNVRLSEEAVMAYIRIREGHTYYERTVQADCQRLLRSERFKSIVADKHQGPEGITVTFVVVERPLVAKLVFKGNKVFDTEKLLTEEMTFGASDPLDAFAVEACRRSLAGKYHESGYYFASVTFDEEALKERNEVIYSIVEGPRVRVRKISVEGHEFFSTWSLKTTIKSSSKPWWLLIGEGYLNTEQVQRDVEALRTKYIEQGFWDAEVSRLIEFSDDKTSVHLTFQIRENSRYRVNTVTFRGNTIFSDAELAERIALRQGEFAKTTVIRQDTDKLRDTYGELGYIEANVAHQKLYPSPEEPLPQWTEKLDGPIALVNLVFDVAEGGQYRVGRVEIRPTSAYEYGGSITQTRVYRRNVTLFPGQLFNTRAARESERRLKETGIFTDATVKPIGDKPGVRDALVQAKETKTGNILLGIGISTNTGVIGNISYVQRNFDATRWPRAWRDIIGGKAWLGAGETFRTSLEPGTVVSRFYVDWHNPAIKDRPLSLGLRGYASEAGAETHDESRQGGRVSLGKRFKNLWYGEVSSRTENVDISDIDSTAPSDITKLSGTNLIEGVQFSLVRDRTDGRWVPSTGDRLRMWFEQVIGDFTFEKVGADYRVYQTLHQDALDRKHILAMKVSAAQILGSAPAFERFYGGGIGSIRGFKYYGISPRSGVDDDPIGGDFRFFAGAEYRYPLIGEHLHGVVFVDSGTVEDNTELGTYRASTGFGIRWTVPMMGPVPVRLDFGFPLMKDSDDDTQLISFSLGWIF